MSITDFEIKKNIKKVCFLILDAAIHQFKINFGSIVKSFIRHTVNFKDLYVIWDISSHIHFQDFKTFLILFMLIKSKFITEI